MRVNIFRCVTPIWLTNLGFLHEDILLNLTPPNLKCSPLMWDISLLSISHADANLQESYSSCLHGLTFWAVRKGKRILNPLLGQLCRDTLLFTLDSILNIYMSTIHPYLKYYWHIWPGVSAIFLQLFDKIQCGISNINSLKVASLWLFQYFPGNCSVFRYGT